MKINPNKLSPANIINTDFQEKSASLMRFLCLVQLLNFTLEIYVPVMITTILKIEYNTYSHIKF